MKTLPKSIFCIIVILLLYLIFPSLSRAVQAASPGDVVINEVMWMGSSASSADEWIEFRNLTNYNINLSGWQIANALSGGGILTIPTEGTHTLPANGFYLISRYSMVDVDKSVLGVITDLRMQGTANFSLANSGNGDLILKDKNGTIIDQAEGDIWPAGDNTLKYSMERKDPPGDGLLVVSWYTATAGINFLLGTSERGTPRTSNSAPPTPTPTPRSSLSPLISFSAPDQVTVGQVFEITVSLISFKPKTSYYLKALIGRDLSSLTNGKTLGGDGQTWLAWNGSWIKMPEIQMDQSGSARMTIKAKTADELAEGTFLLVIRVKETSDSETSDSDSRNIQISLPTLTTFTSTPTLTPTPYLSYLPYSILEAKNQSLGSNLSVEGIITAPPEILGSRVMFVQQDGVGIKIKLADLDYSQLDLGDKVEVKGELKESFQEKYLKDSGQTVTFLAKGALPEPHKVKTGEVNEDLEGRLVVVNGEVVETSGSTFYLDDGSGSIKIYIKSTTEIEKPKMRKGYFAKVVGIVSQYKDDYRILPRFQEDLLVSDQPIGDEVKFEGESWVDSPEADELLNADGEVLGTVTELPATGVDLGPRLDPVVSFLLFILNFLSVFLHSGRFGKIWAD